MYLDVKELQQFYYQTRLGRAVQRALRDQIMRFWPNAKGQTVVGYGFAVPLLRPFLGDAARVIALMPGPQGAMPWPAAAPNHSVLCDEIFWPIKAQSVDKLIVLHGLDASDNATALLEECYRVLADHGSAVFIVPNRVSLWSRREGTPFSLSRPFSASQLEKRLRWHGLQPVHHVTALYQPPWTSKFWRRVGPAIERIGQAIPTWRGGGALIVEVEKQVPRPARPGLGQIISKPLSVLEGLGAPKPKPASLRPVNQMFRMRNKFIKK